MINVYYIRFLILLSSSLVMTWDNIWCVDEEPKIFSFSGLYFGCLRNTIYTPSGEHIFLNRVFEKNYTRREFFFGAISTLHFSKSTVSGKVTITFQILSIPDFLNGHNFIHDGNNDFLGVYAYLCNRVYGSHLLITFLIKLNSYENDSSAYLGTYQPYMAT